ncbi:unnamed protein product [Tenebrio molitor]|nr:unnamed protein product [Tenebrio molitor]
MFECFHIRRMFLLGFIEIVASRRTLVPRSVTTLHVSRRINTSKYLSTFNDDTNHRCCLDKFSKQTRLSTPRRAFTYDRLCMRTDPKDFEIRKSES